MEELLIILTKLQHIELCQGYQCYKDCPIGKDLCDEIGYFQGKLEEKLKIK